nr:RNA-directed DNA polymerase, eukaryota, reverse transcriptase zinc-binding domain protein [Tanacetum cinerariifolium]
MTSEGSDPDAEYALSRLLQRGVQIQDLKETIRHKPNKIEAFQTSMVATFEEHEQQENQDNMNEFSEEKDDAKSSIFIDTVGNNGDNDSRTSGSETPAKKVVDNGIESEVVVGLPDEFQEGDMVDALSIRNPIKLYASTQQLPKASHDRHTFNTNNLPPKRSYASVTHAESRNNFSQQSKLDNIKSIQLNDDDLILVEDSSTVVLKTISNMYHVCQAEGFVDVKIHYVGGLWVWLQFSLVNSCEAFKSNESLNKLWTFIKVSSPSFVVDERVIWIEVSGLPLSLDDVIQQNIVKESALKDSKEGDQANVSTHVAGDNETLFSGKVKEEYLLCYKGRQTF